jgi:hypothetical protein
VVIGIHVLLGSLVNLTLTTGWVSETLAMGIALGELVVPAILLGSTRCVSTFVRLLIVLLCLEVTAFQTERELYLVLAVFALQTVVMSFSWTLSTGWQLGLASEPRLPAVQKLRFSLMQLMAMTTAVAIVLAAGRARSGNFGILHQGQWHEWVLITSVACLSFLVCCATFAGHNSAIKLTLAAIILVSAAGAVLKGTFSGGWLFVIAILAAALSAQIPAFVLRKYGWHWVRPGREVPISESPERGEIS